VTETDPVDKHDRRYIREAVQEAKRRAPSVAAVVFDFIERLLTKGLAGTASGDCAARARFIGKFQQITSPVAAKGIEDTALYVYNRLVSLNEVGSDPTQFGLEPSAVHAWMSTRNARWPSALSATATHDTKRGEDVRARLDVLSEMPGAWKSGIARWRVVNRRFKTEVKGVAAPGANEEYLIYQTLLGAWPFETDPETRAAFCDRVVAYMTKAMSEAKVHTSWLNPDTEYEAAVERFVRALLDRRRMNMFLQSFEPLQARVANLGIANSLAQLLLKITAPGIPDFYQGTEFWDLNLVDPDNRRGVDYTVRRERLAGLDGVSAEELLAHRVDGRVKMFVTRRGLRARAERREVFERGDYVPLEITGARRDNLFAFARTVPGDAAITCVPRLVASMAPDGAPALGRGVWADTRIELPPQVEARTFRDAFTGAVVEPEDANGRRLLAAATVFERFPIALLLPCSI
jgi:(1->4)-alpha-D-glucan 1-alpha-D-glucosylmutase